MQISVDQSSFYRTYNGHELKHLKIIFEELRRSSKVNGIVYLAGDSSLDNKFWFSDTAPAVNGYERVLKPPVMKQDVCYWINRELSERGAKLVCLNTAVEATALSDRSCGSLLPQDEFIRDRICSDDYLIVSIGGNDIALKPLLCTICNIIPLACCTPAICLESCSCANPPNCRIDCGCAGCGIQGCISGLIGCPPGLGYFIDLFRNHVQNYVERLVGKKKPRKVLVNMIYYPDEASTGSWADGALGCLGYDTCPRRLQLLIRTAFELGTRKIVIPGTEVIPVPLFKVLDAKDSGDFLQRVEPSVVGGSKMARRFVDIILQNGAVDGRSVNILSTTLSPVAESHISERT